MWELWCLRFAAHGSFDVRQLLSTVVAMCGDCGVWVLQYEGVAGFWSPSVWESWCTWELRCMGVVVCSGGAPCQMIKQMVFEFLSLTRRKGIVNTKNYDFLLLVTIVAMLN